MDPTTVVNNQRRRGCRTVHVPLPDEVWQQVTDVARTFGALPSGLVRQLVIEKLPELLRQRAAYRAAMEQVKAA